MLKYTFHLYVTDQTSRSLHATANLRRICDQCLYAIGATYELRVINVQEHPDLAKAAHIFATPTTIRIAPLPVHRVIGDLSDPVKVLAALGIVSDDAGSVPKENLL